MRLEVFGFLRERGRDQPQLREATSGFLEEGGYCIYLKAEDRRGLKGEDKISEGTG